MPTLFERGQALARENKARVREFRRQGQNIQTSFVACYACAEDYESVHATLGSKNIHPWEEYQEKMSGFISELSDSDPFRFVELAKTAYKDVLMDLVDSGRLHIAGELPTTGTMPVAMVVALVAQKHPHLVLTPSEAIRRGLS
jgi:hypothetical protein